MKKSTNLRRRIIDKQELILKTRLKLKNHIDAAKKESEQLAYLLEEYHKLVKQREERLQPTKK